MALTNIEWVKNPDGSKGMTWNPVTGCSKISAGCKLCYAERMDRRQMWPGRMGGFREWTAPNAEHNVRLHPERLDQPLRWKKPRKVFVCSVSDLFHERVPDGFIESVFGVMAVAKHHTFQILTKRPSRMREFLEKEHPPFVSQDELVASAAEGLRDVDGNRVVIWDARGNKRENYALVTRPIDDDQLKIRQPWPGWPLPNVWLGVSAEDQPNFDERVVELLQTPAAVRFVSLEPLLGPIDTSKYTGYKDCTRRPLGLDLIIVGGESGPGARPMHPDWVRPIRDQCVEAGVPFFFKQWGEWVDVEQAPEDTVSSVDASVNLAGNPERVFRVGKKHAGRELDGKVWNQLP